jgi:hypothetical protein
MSAILDIYTSIANMEVGDIPSRNINAVKLTIRDGDLPLRLLLPATEGDMAFVAIGTLQKVTWVIRDLCLWAPVTKGSGVQDFSEAMVDYLALYLEQIKGNRSPVAQCHISGVAVKMVPVKWGEQTYWGVDITLTVEEIL